MARSERFQFVADGQWRSRAAHRPIVVAEVETEFAKRLENAAFWQRWIIRLEINKEVERRLNVTSPPDALY